MVCVELLCTTLKLLLLDISIIFIKNTSNSEDIAVQLKNKTPKTFQIILNVHLLYNILISIINITNIFSYMYCQMYILFKILFLDLCKCYLVYITPL